MAKDVPKNDKQGIASKGLRLASPPEEGIRDSTVSPQAAPTDNRKLGTPCPDCGALPGELHTIMCDVERCPHCGGQLISCECECDLTKQRLPWTGEWPGVMECREFGWYAKLVSGKGWQTCTRDDPGAQEDLNRLNRDAVWSKDLGRFVLPGGK